MADMGVRLVVRVEGGGEEPPVPGAVASALVRASAQAAANAVQHAGGRGLTALVRRPAGAPSDAPAVEIVVTDTGPGFDIDAVPDDRLGISASILARVAAVGGTAHISSSSRGTIVTLTWQQAAS